MQDNTNENLKEKQNEDSALDFFNTAMATIPTKYHSHGGPKFTKKKPKRTNTKHGIRKKK